MTERPSLDAAVEAMCRSEHPLWGQYRPDARAEVAQKMSRALDASLPHLPAALVDRPREPSPELHEKVAEAIERGYESFNWAFPRDQLWPYLADAVLAELREEQG